MRPVDGGLRSAARGLLCFGQLLLVNLASPTLCLGQPPDPGAAQGRSGPTASTPPGVTVRVVPMVSAAPQPMVEVHPLVVAAIKEISAEQIEKSLGEVKALSAGAYQAAQAAQASASSDTALVVGLMQSFLGFLALLFALAAFAGYDRWKRVSKLEADARAHLEEAQSTLAAAANASAEIGRMRAAMVESWIDVDRAFARLPQVEALGIIRLSQPKTIPPESAVIFEDSDALLVVCDHLGIISDKARCAEHLKKLSVYWRISKAYAKSLARARRAFDLAPANAQIANEIGKTLSRWGANEPPGSAEREIRLQHAIDAHRSALALAGTEDPNILHDMAWTFDELGDYPRAIEYYRRAAAVEHDLRWKVNYNLACSLTLCGQFEAALDALAQSDAAGLPVADDPDLASLKNHAVHGARFMEIVSQLARTVQ